MTQEQEIANYIQDRGSANKQVLLEAIVKYKASIHTLKKAANYILKGKYGSVDTQDKELIEACKKVWFLSHELRKSDDYIKEAIVPKEELNVAPMQVGTKVISHNDDYGSGVIEQIFKDGTLCLVRFEKRKLPIMCNLKLMSTVHLDKGNAKFKLA